MSRVFVSYRRDDAANDAGRLAEHLRAYFGAHNVFIDVDTIEYGDDFVDKIQREVGSSDILLAVMGRGWLAAQDDQGRRRIDNPGDFVRLEITTALKRNIRVVPVLVQRAAMPKEGELPDDLAGLLRRNALEVRETQFARDVEALIDSLAGRRRSGLAGLLRRPGSWAIAGLVLAALGGGLMARHALSPSPPVPPPSPTPVPGPAASLFDVPLKLRMYLDRRFGAVDPTVKLTLLHKSPIFAKDRRYLEVEGTPPPPFEYESSVWMPRGKGDTYTGEVRRVPETGVKVSGSKDNADNAVPPTMEVCFVRKADDVADREAPVEVECREGSACRVTDSNAVRPCPRQSSQGWQWIGVADAQPKRPESAVAADREPRWVVPSLETLRALKTSAKGVGYTEFFLTSGPLPSLREADRLVYAIRVNGTPVYIDGWEPAAQSMPFEPSKGLSLEFGLENLDFSGEHAGMEEIDVALGFSQGARVFKNPVIRLRYVALRDAAECAVKVTDDLTIRWRAHYVHPQQEDVYQIFLTAAPIPPGGDRQAVLRAVEGRKSQIDSAGLRVDGKEVVAVIRPPITINPSYGIVLGLRQPTGQVKFTFDDATSQRLQKELADLARRTKLVEATAYRRNVGSRTETTPCPSAPPTALRDRS